MSTKPPIAARIPSATWKIFFIRLRAPPDAASRSSCFWIRARLLVIAGVVAQPGELVRDARRQPRGPDRSRSAAPLALLLKTAGPRPCAPPHRGIRCGRGRRRRSSGRRPHRRRRVRLRRRATGSPRTASACLSARRSRPRRSRRGAAARVRSAPRVEARSRQYPLQTDSDSVAAKLTVPAPVAQGIERCPAEAEVACSNHAGRIVPTFLYRPDDGGAFGTAAGWVRPPRSAVDPHWRVALFTAPRPASRASSASSVSV